MLFVSDILPRRSHRKPYTLQDRLGPPRKIASPALQDRLAGAIASLESWARNSLDNDVYWMENSPSPTVEALIQDILLL
ncbi:hypothetical protein SO802_028660 [Lithocarpus litseifolius]|uniref:Uncharacterized protein n=1 Tax=Lithocarpus litseifolius TaxID=425828 RepID=A0AAW2BSX3_9ROSI